MSLNPEFGVIEDIGDLSFEVPFWEGEHSVPGYGLPFRPIDLGNEALREFFGSCWKVAGTNHASTRKKLRFHRFGRYRRPTRRPNLLRYLTIAEITRPPVCSSTSGARRRS
ncbi:DUF6928 family protein [Amycolatopsis taiwanensis]|uniref:DUF6928 family protein n=1 Tax=Amycolatopsis taiwanensis TaxID=342230 RepID=UPI003D7F82BD